jgi:hypothetical protein
VQSSTSGSSYHHILANRIQKYARNLTSLLRVHPPRRTVPKISKRSNISIRTAQSSHAAADTQRAQLHRLTCKQKPAPVHTRTKSRTAPCTATRETRIPCDQTQQVPSRQPQGITACGVPPTHVTPCDCVSSVYEAGGVAAGSRGQTLQCLGGECSLPGLRRGKCVDRRRLLWRMDGAMRLEGRAGTGAVSCDRVGG